VGAGRRRRHSAVTVTCKEFCAQHGYTCQRAELTNHRQCDLVRSWDCTAPPPSSSSRRRQQHLKCTCLDAARPSDSRIHAKPLMLPSLANGETCTDVGYQKVSLHVDVQASRVIVSKREQTPETHQDFNDIGGYELCDGVELTPPTSSNYCSTGNRIGGSAKNPCMMRLEQLTYAEASSACAVRGGHLAHVQSSEELESLRRFSDGRELGIGLRVVGAADWRFDGAAGLSANKSVDIFKAKFGDEFTRTGCVRLRQRRPLLASLDCNTKFDWICEGTLNNTLSAQEGIVALNDLKADEGAFCLWDLKEPVDSLPNDEGTNFRNTDLACPLQVSSRNSHQCAYDPKANRLLRQRGDRKNAANYPVLGSEIGWKGSAANDTFLSVQDADDYFHCHYSPSNSGLLRMFAVQHMFERNYPGALKRKCGCGYKFLSKLVSRCDCTRSGKADNGCARWHSTLLTRATKDQPVRCNNCNQRHNL